MRGADRVTRIVWRPRRQSEDGRRRFGQGGQAKRPQFPNTPSSDNAQVDLASFPQDKDGYYVIFDGKTLNGWRGYGKENVPSRWTIDDGAIKFNGSGGGEAQTGEGGDLIFAKKFKNFELEMEWKVSKGGNSGIFYLAQEVTTQKDGKTKYEPIYISCPEYQVLDNANHPDAKLGVDGNRQSASLYDMIPAVPQNQKPFGEWNKAKIMVYKGTVVHGQNDQNVVEYHLWTPQWTEMLENSKFSSEEVAAGVRTAQQLRRREPRRLHRSPGPRRRRLVPQHPHQDPRLRSSRDREDPLF